MTLGFEKGIINPLNLPVWCFEKEGAGLVAVVALVTGTKIYGDDISGIDEAV